LRLAQQDVSRQSLDQARVATIRDAVGELVDDLADREDRTPERGTKEDVDATATGEVATSSALPDLPVLAEEELAPGWRGETPVLCVAGRSGLDEAAAIMLAQLLAKHGIRARVEGAEALSSTNIFRLGTEGIAAVFVSYLDASSQAHMRYTVRRLRRRLPHATIVLGDWLADGSRPVAMTEAVKADGIVTTLRQAVELAVECASGAASTADTKSGAAQAQWNKPDP
jgi:hypothetical protein